MRYFFARRGPSPDAPPSRMLLVESGSRSVLESGIERFRSIYGDLVQFDLLTCLPGLPQALNPASTRVFRVTECRTRADRRKLLGAIRRQGYRLLGIICSDEPVMTPWKIAVAAILPAKVLVFNENADFFWLDWRHRGAIRRFVFARAGLLDEGAVRKLARVAAFPSVLVYLLAYAAWIHLRRRWRVALGR